MYLNNESIMRKFEGKKCFIYGAGKDGERFYKIFSDKIVISGFIVTEMRGQIFMGRPIFSNSVCTRSDVRGNIIIATKKYENEILDILRSVELEAGRDFFVWDEPGEYDPDGATRRLIAWNKKTWKTGKVQQDNKVRILIPIERVLDSHSIYYAYTSNYLRNKYNAKVDCYIRNGDNSTLGVIKTIYSSFGANSIVYPELTDEQQRVAKELFEREWEKIHAFEDWKNIKIYDINFGTTIIRSYLRFKPLNIEPCSEEFKSHLKECIKTIVFWFDRFSEMDYQTVLMWDGAHWEGFIREIAISRNIPVYASNYGYRTKLYHDYATEGKQHINYKKFWNMLSDEEKEYGIEWSKRILFERLIGKASNDDKEVIAGKDPYTMSKAGRVLKKNSKIKVMIAPHIFDEDCYQYGDQIFDNNYISWLVHLGEISKRLNRYDWYIKLHPHGGIRDKVFFEQYLRKYSHIKKIDKMISPIQLREEGLQFALSVHGTIGSEYPLLGIQVINAGANPHMAFDFNWNPSTKDEFDKLLFNLENLNNLKNRDDIYKFYAVHRLFYNHDARMGTQFFEGFQDKTIGMLPFDLSQNHIGKKIGTWKYNAFLKEIDDFHHKELSNSIEMELIRMENWTPDYFYKNDSCVGNRI